MSIRWIFKLFSIAKSFLRVQYNNFKFKYELRVNKNVFVGRNVLIDPGYNQLISIGKNSIISYGVSILAHDGSLNYIGYTRVARIKIGSNCFLGLGSLILPGVTIGNNSIIGAGSIVTRDIPANCVAVGNPAKVICSVDEYQEKHNKLMKTHPVYEKLDKYNRNKTLKELEYGNVYIKTCPENCKEN